MIIVMKADTRPDSPELAPATRMAEDDLVLADFHGRPEGAHEERVERTALPD